MAPPLIRAPDKPRSIGRGTRSPTPLLRTTAHNARVFKKENSSGDRRLRSQSPYRVQRDSPKVGAVGAVYARRGRLPFTLSSSCTPPPTPAPPPPPPPTLPPSTVGVGNVNDHNESYYHLDNNHDSNPDNSNGNNIYQNRNNSGTMARVKHEREDSIMTDADAEEYKVKPEPTDDDSHLWENVKDEYGGPDSKDGIKREFKLETKMEDDDDEILEEEKIDPSIHLGTDGLRLASRRSATPTSAAQPRTGASSAPPAKSKPAQQHHRQSSAGPSGTAKNPVDVESHKNLSGVNLLVSQSKGPRRSLFFLRFRIQRIHTKAKADPSSMTEEDYKQAKNIIEHIAWHPFETLDEKTGQTSSGGMGPTSDYKVTKIAAALKCFTDPLLYPPSVVDAAQRLLDHWSTGKLDGFTTQEQSQNTTTEADEGSESDDSLFDEAVPRSSTSKYRHTPTGSSGPRAPIDPSTRDNRISPEELMRGIVITRPKPGQPGSRSYKLDPRYPKVPADVFGHNGHRVGAWWPYQVCALRDGAHGSRMGGIHGRIDVGCFSVVISGGTYDGNDTDMGDRVLYSGSKGENDEDMSRAIAPLTNATKSLITSSNSRMAVRVLRSYKGTSRWAPSQGIRYDGLYNVARYGIETGADGKKFYQFELVRCANQPPIDRNRPTREELRALDLFQRTL